jgi:hypothetical protein
MRQNNKRSLPRDSIYLYQTDGLLTENELPQSETTDDDEKYNFKNASGSLIKTEDPRVLTRPSPSLLGLPRNVKCYNSYNTQHSR